MSFRSPLYSGDRPIKVVGNFDNNNDPAPGSANPTDFCPSCDVHLAYFEKENVWFCKYCGYGLPDHIRNPEKVGVISNVGGDNIISQAVKLVKNKIVKKE